MNDLLNQCSSSWQAITIAVLLTITVGVAVFTIQLSAHDAGHGRAVIAAAIAHLRGRATQRKIEDALRKREHSLDI